MLPAVTFQDILDRVPPFGGGPFPAGERLVSILFAAPGSPLWRDVYVNRAFYDKRSGKAWDLFFAGLSRWVPPRETRKQLKLIYGAGEHRHFEVDAFDELEDAISSAHAEALSGDGIEGSWRYSGGDDLVSFMCYAQDPDWLSLRSVTLSAPTAGSSERPTIGQVVEGLRRWQEGLVEPGLAPGEFRRDELKSSLLPALFWSANAIAAGIVGDAAYDLLKNITER